VVLLQLERSPAGLTLALLEFRESWDSFVRPLIVISQNSMRTHAKLREGKQRVSRKRVARLMRQAGLVGRPPRRFRRTTVADPKVQVDDLAQRNFTATEPDQKWFGDITYIRT
jgi:hypothetical protein